jgi:hypothetical protein
MNDYVMRYKLKHKGMASPKLDIVEELPAPALDIYLGGLEEDLYAPAVLVGGRYKDTDRRPKSRSKYTGYDANVYTRHTPTPHTKSASTCEHKLKYMFGGSNISSIHSYPPSYAPAHKLPANYNIFQSLKDIE